VGKSGRRWERGGGGGSGADRGGGGEEGGGGGGGSEVEEEIGGEKKGTGRGGGEDEEKREMEGRSEIIVVLEVCLPVQVTLLSHEVIQKWTVTVPCDQRPRKNKVPLEQ